MRQPSSLARNSAGIAADRILGYSDMNDIILTTTHGAGGFKRWIFGSVAEKLINEARVPVLVIDEVCYIPFEPEAANLFFQLISGRYERASVIVTSNKPFGRWGEVLNTDATVYGGSDAGNGGGVDTLDESTIPEVSLVVPPLAAIFLVPER